MYVGVNRWSLPRDLSLQQSIALAAQAGFDTVELNMELQGDLACDSNETATRAIAMQVSAAGLGMTSVSTALYWHYPITSPDEATRQRGIELMRCQLQAAQWMGADTILVVPGVVDAQTSYADAYERAGLVLRELAPEAARLKVNIGVENVWNKFLLSPLEMARFLDEIDSPWVGAYFDVGNVLNYGYPEQWIETLGARIRKVHVKDFRRNVGNITGFCHPPFGDVDWQRVRDALRAIGYDDTVTAEVDVTAFAPEVALSSLAAALKALFA